MEEDRPAPEKMDFASLNNKQPITLTNKTSEILEQVKTEFKKAQNVKFIISLQYD